MNRITLLLGLVGALALPTTVLAQHGSQAARPRTSVNRHTNTAAPRLGFAIGANVGPNNRAGHPFVHTVVPGSNAARAGIEVGDTILAINGRDARVGRLFPAQVAGTRYLLRVRRGREELELTYIFPVTPPRGARPSEPARRQ